MTHYGLIDYENKLIFYSDEAICGNWVDSKSVANDFFKKQTLPIMSFILTYDTHSLF